MSDELESSCNGTKQHLISRYLSEDGSWEIGSVLVWMER